MNWLYKLFGTLLYWFSSITGGNYAIALLLYALLFKIVFLPFTIKQQKNQIAMAKLTPKIELIKAKYKGRTDRVTQQKMQQEIMDLQQKEGYSPFAGCLPMLIQLPIIIFLYNVIRNPLSHILQLNKESITAIRDTIGEAAKNVDQIGLISLIEKNGLNVADFGAKRVLPDFELFGLNLAETPSFTNFSLLVLIPVLAAAAQWLTMFITRKLNNTGLQQQNDAQTQMSLKMMDIVMPLMTLWMAFNFSGMLGLYWVYQSLLAILQSFIISKIMPLPRYTEEELKAMRKAQKEQEKAQKAALKEQPKYRSYHYIDDDDYEDLPEIKTNTSNQKKGNSSDAPEIKD